MPKIVNKLQFRIGIADPHSPVSLSIIIPDRPIILWQNAQTDSQNRGQINTILFYKVSNYMGSQLSSITSSFNQTDNIVVFNAQYNIYNWKWVELNWNPEQPK